MFVSTRGKKMVNSFEAIVKGLADDGGLYVIDEIPSLDYKEMLNDDYITIATKVLNAFFPEFGYDVIFKEIKEAYATFDINEVVTLKETKKAFFLELFHGPTLAFKDLALVVLPRLMSLSKKRLNQNEKTTILTATSGDTGGAALNGFKDIDNINIIVLYPNNGVSPIQEAQMCSFRSDNAKVIAVEGNFDDCQNIVKEFFNENTDLSISSANSINIARLIPQVVYYFYSYINLLNRKAIKTDELINFDVPTGNFGDIFAGFYAKLMGLPINKLICASNKNKVLTDFFNNGVYDKNRDFYKTNTPSMDILISSNLERLLYYGLNCDSSKVRDLMSSLKMTGKYDFKNPFNEFYASYCSEIDTKEAIKSLFNNEGYLMDPHTAVAYKVYLDYLKETGDQSKTVVISTASPFKFPESIIDSLDLPKSENAFEMIDIISKNCNVVIPSVLNYGSPIQEIWEKEKVKEKLRAVIKC